MSHLELHAHLKIRPGQLEGFKAQASEIIRITREQDTKTLRYDWFIKEDGTARATSTRLTPTKTVSSSTTCTSSRREPFCSETAHSITA
jgi:hypothetical protein